MVCGAPDTVAVEPEIVAVAPSATVTDDVDSVIEKSRVAAEFCTVNGAAALDPTSPAASYAFATSECAPSAAVVVSHAKEMDAALAEAMLAPSSHSSIRVTARLSVALAESVA